jgi:hypothetical protein
VREWEVVLLHCLHAKVGTLIILSSRRGRERKEEEQEYKQLHSQYESKEGKIIKKKKERKDYTCIP